MWGSPRFAGLHTRVIDLKGATVIPGLCDSHLHTLGVARDIFNIGLQEVRSIANVQATTNPTETQSALRCWLQ